MNSLEYADCIITALGESFCKEPKMQVRALYELTVYTGEEHKTCANDTNCVRHV